jgi:uncharacterized membrane protein YjgN (DUF898 family)
MVSGPGEAAKCDVERQDRIEITAKGGEYFRIWIVNVPLSLATLGIYSAWGTVRSTGYFRNTTSINGKYSTQNEDFIALLKNRIMAVVVLLASIVSEGLGLPCSVVFPLMIAVVAWLSVHGQRLPIALQRSVRFGFPDPVLQRIQTLCHSLFAKNVLVPGRSCRLYIGDGLYDREHATVVQAVGTAYPSLPTTVGQKQQTK